MPTVPSNAPSSTTASSKPGGADYEPDEEWKEQLRERIEEGLQSMVADAKENQAAELKKAPDTPEARMRLEADYKQAMQTIKSLASEQYQLELDRERNQRRWTAGIPMNPGWTQFFREEQQNIMNSIKQSSNRTDNSVRTASESPTEECRSTIPKPSNEPPALAPPPGLSVPPSPSVRPTEERDKSFVSPQSVRRGSDAHAVSRDRDEHLVCSPPRAPPEVWKPAIPPAEDALPAKTYNLGRRGSAASMRSTGSGASIRPSITETIPERADDDEPDEFVIRENDYERAQETTEQGKIRISTDKSRNKEKRPHHRRNSRQSPVDAGLRSDELLGSSSLRSASSSTMQYVTSPPPNRPLSAQPSLIFDDRRHPIDSSGKPPPYYEQSSSRDSYPHREVPFQDHPSARPIPAKSAYGGDDRDYDPHSPHGPKSPYHHSQWESRPISRRASFIRQPYVDIDDEDVERDLDRRGRGERHWDREYDRDIDRDIYSEPRHATTYPYAVPRHSSYPNPSSRHVPQDYVHMSDIHDDREGAPGPSHGRYNYRGLPPDDWRPPDSAHPGLSRQSSYVRLRDDPDRRFTGEDDGHPRHSPASGIPIPRHTPSFEEPLAHPALRDWAAEGNRHPNYQQARSPPNVESFSHRRFTQPPPLDHSSSPHGDRPSFGVRETDSSHRGNSTVTEEYDSNEDIDSEDDDDDDDDDGSSEAGIEARRLRDLEARRQKLEEHMREADDELKRTELEIQQLASEEARKKKEDEERRDEARRKEEEAIRREDEARRMEAEIRRLAEEVKKKEEDAAKRAEEAAKMEAEAKRKEREVKIKEQEARKKEAAAKRKVEEARRRAEELTRKEEEAKQRAAQLEQDAEKTKQMQLEAQKFAEDLKKMEEEALRKDMEMKEREDVLRRREEELMRREADNFRREVEAKKKEEETRKREELKKEEARHEARLKEEARKEKARQEEEEEARKEQAKREEEARQDEARKEEETRKEKEAQQKTAERARRKADEAAKRNEGNLRRGARFEDFRREQDEKCLQDEGQHFDDLFIEDLKTVDPNLMDEQVKVLQQAEFRKREEEIRRTREERKRNGSVGNDSAWSGPHLSASPGTHVKDTSVQQRSTHS